VANPYDAVRYPSQTFAETHPITMGVFSALYGRPYAPFATARVLEIGCNGGVNLINMAFGAPLAEFVGVDLAEQPIARARATARSCGCDNVDFHLCDLAEIDESYGSFDYIIAHGVYAWIPAGSREALMRVIGERLSADGLALVSYNALPGSRLREAVRDMLLTVSNEAEDPKEKLDLARSLLSEYIELWSDTEADEMAVKFEARRILSREPEAIFHDELNQDYAPQLLSAAVAAAARFGLDYLCDAEPNSSAEILFPSEAFAPMRAWARGDWTRFEQLMDFRTMRRFRYSIFCRGAADRRREPMRLRGLWACGELKALEADPEAPDGAEFEAVPKVKIKTRDPKLVKFLSALAAAFPLAIPLDSAAENPVLADYVFRLFTNRVIQVTIAQWPLVAVAGERPKASPLARLQAATGAAVVSTLRHDSMRIDGAPALSLLTLMDGSRTREELAVGLAEREGLSSTEASARLDRILTDFAKGGLLAG
jgi:hypothetical protein